MKLKLKYILDGLYSDDLNQIIHIINQSKYITDIHGLTDKFIIHTGFRFSVQTETTFDLFYDVEENILIRQKRFPNKAFPCVLGLFCKFEGLFLNKHSMTLFNGISECQEFVSTSRSFHYIDSKSLDYDRFLTYQKNQAGEICNITAFPLEKMLSEVVYLSNGFFSILKSDADLRRERQEEQDRNEKEAYERRELERDNFDAYTDGNAGSFDDYEGGDFDYGLWSGRD